MASVPEWVTVPAAWDRGPGNFRRQLNSTRAPYRRRRLTRFINRAMSAITPPTNLTGSGRWESDE